MRSRDRKPTWTANTYVRIISAWHVLPNGSGFSRPASASCSSRVLGPACDIVAEAQATPGSFTNHFRSKEEFVLEVLNRYFAHVQGLVADALGNRELSPAARLRRYLDVITLQLEAAEWSRGCLIGDLSLEATGQSETIRERLASIFQEWRRPFAACIAEGQAAGEIVSTFPPDELAEFLLASWQGAILRMKVDRDAAPLERFKAIAFDRIFSRSS